MFCIYLKLAFWIVYGKRNNIGNRDNHFVTCTLHIFLWGLSVTHQSKPQNRKYEVEGQEYNDAFHISWTCWLIQSECESFSRNILGENEKKIKKESRLTESWGSWCQRSPLWWFWWCCFGSNLCREKHGTGLAIGFSSEFRSSCTWNRTREQSEKHVRSYCTGTGRILHTLVCRHTAAMNY